MSRFNTSFPGGAENPISDGGNWVAAWAYNGLQRLSAGIVQPIGNAADCAMVYSGTFGADQTVKATILTLNDPALAAIGVLCRGSDNIADNTHRNFYRVNAQINTAGTIMSKRVAGSSTTLWTDTTTVWLPGDIVEIRAIGNQISAYRNGVLITTTATGSNPATDSSLTGAGTQVGIILSTTTTQEDAQVSVFDGGDAPVAGITPNIGAILGAGIQAIVGRGILTQSAIELG